LTAGVLVGAFLFLLAIPGMFIGWSKNLDYLRLWQERVVTNQQIGTTENFNIHSFRNQSLANSVYLLTRTVRHAPAADSIEPPPPDPAERFTLPAVKAVQGAMLAVLAALGLAIGRRSRGIDQATAYSLAAYATLVLSPLAWAHYFVVELPALICVPLWLSTRGRSTLAWVVPVIPPLLSWSYYLPMKTTGPLGLLGLGTTAWFVVVCGWILVLHMKPPLRATSLHSSMKTRVARNHRVDCPLLENQL